LCADFYNKHFFYLERVERILVGADVFVGHVDAGPRAAHQAGRLEHARGAAVATVVLAQRLTNKNTRSNSGQHKETRTTEQQQQQQQQQRETVNEGRGTCKQRGKASVIEFF